MGTYLNPGNSGFDDICRGRYVDKTGMIALINETIGTPDKLTCVSRLLYRSLYSGCLSKSIRLLSHLPYIRFFGYLRI